MFEWQPRLGTSVGWILVFFVPLAIGAATMSFLFLSGQESKGKRLARILSVAWLIASGPAWLMIFMGAAFTPSASPPPWLTFSIWVGVGYLLIWVPVLLARGDKDVDF